MSETYYFLSNLAAVGALGALAEARALLGEARALLCDPDGDEFAADKLLARIEEALA